MSMIPKVIPVNRVNGIYPDRSGNIVVPNIGGGIPEAPVDGKQYGRQNKQWTEVENAESCSHPILDRFKGKKMAVLGDSISAVPNGTAKKVWHQWVQELLGISSVVNYSEGGRTIARRGNDNNMLDHYAGMDDDADLICVFGGTNDWGMSVPLGAINSTQGSLFAGAVKSLIEGLLDKYPAKDIVFFTPMQRAHAFLDPPPNPIPFTDYNTSLMLLCSSYSIPVYDTWHSAGISAAMSAQKAIYMADSTHPNNAGQERLGRAFASFLISPTTNLITPETVTRLENLVTEAPVDGKQYGRQNKQWTNIVGGTPIEPELGQHFRYSIHTQQTSTGINGTEETPSYRVPVSTAFAYDWEISWGDGTIERATGMGAESNDGIYHEFPAHGEYWITIRPYDLDAHTWLNAFSHSGTNAATTDANKRKIVTVDCPLTTQMFMNPTSTTTTTATLRRMFLGCNGFGFNLSEKCILDSSWASVLTLALNFMVEMFNGCTTLKKLPSKLNLPRNIVSGSNGFTSMLQSCTALQSLPDDFNLPNVTSVGNTFCSYMFYNCNSLVLSANNKLRLPNVTTTATTEVNAPYYRMFFSTSSSALPLQGINAEIIRNSATLPQGLNNQCFRITTNGNDSLGRARWADWDSIPSEWK